jgi:hypothetical protein
MTDRPDVPDLTEQSDRRAHPLPEERAVERGDEDRRGQAERILDDSEQRVADAAGAEEHRRSADTA